MSCFSEVHTHGVLQDSSKIGDDRKLWRVITSLNGTPKNTSMPWSTMTNQTKESWHLHKIQVSAILICKRNIGLKTGTSRVLCDLLVQINYVPDFKKYELRYVFKNMCFKICVFKIMALLDCSKAYDTSGTTTTQHSDRKRTKQ